MILVAIAVLGQAAYLDALYWDALGLGPLAPGGISPALLSAVITGAVVSLIAGVLALILTGRPEGVRGSRPMGLALAAWSYLLAYSGLTVLFAPELTSAWRFFFEAHFLAVEALGLAALLRFTVLFPAPLHPESLQPPNELALGLSTVQHLRIWLLSPAGPWATGAAALAVVLATNAAMGRSSQDAALLPMTDLMRLAALAFVVLNLRAAFVASDRPARRHMFWMVVGFILLLGAIGALLGGNVLVAVTGWEIPGINWRPIVLDLGVLGLLGGTGMAVLYEGPLRSGVFTRRITVLLTMLTAALFLAAGMETLLMGRAHVLPGTGTVIAIVGMGLLYARTRHPLEGMLYHTWAAPKA